MSTLTTHTTASRDSHSIGLCKFNTTRKAIEVSDGTSWLVYDYDQAIGYAGNSYGVSYDGTDDYHEVALDGTSTGGVLASSDTDIELTLSFWFNPSGGDIFGWQSTPAASTPTILFTPQSSAGTTYKIYYAGNYRHTFSSSEIVVGSWNHFMITRTASNNTWSIFCNGNSTPVDTYVQSGSLTSRVNMTNMYFSRAYYGYGQNVFDEIAFWNSDQSSNLSSISALLPHVHGSPQI